MKSFRYLLSFATAITALIFLAGCQQSPTKIVTQYKRSAVGGFLKPGSVVDLRKLPTDTLILDVRPRLNYSLAHLQDSLLLDSDEFFETTGRFKNYPKSDVASMTRRLAQLGVDTKTQVLIIGEGKKGDGSEGRLAWLLKGLGVAKVEVVAFDGIHNRKVINGDPEQNLNSKELWQSSLDPARLTEKNEIKDFASGKFIKSGQRVHLIDVRSETEFFKKIGFGEGYETPNLNSINIPWTDFLRSDGRIDREILVKLKGVGILPTDRVIVMSNRGRRSSFVAYALEELGYKNVANAIGGIDELLRNQ